VHQKKGDIGIDLYRGVCDIIADAQNLPFRDNVFEKVSIFSVLEHLNNPMKCLQDTIRVAKDGADFEIVFPVESRVYRGIEKISS
jgi:ubiquinone/menaquinone biosynthesis C-methylase UbiE